MSGYFLNVESVQKFMFVFFIFSDFVASYWDKN